MILHRYYAWRYLKAFLGTVGVFFAMLLMIDFVEQARRYGDTTGIDELLAVSLLNIPSKVYEILPLIVIISGIALFLGLARSSELVVTRAAGRSALVALIAPVAMTLLIGAAAVALINPLVAATTRAYEARTDSLKGEERVITLSDDGLWLRQGDSEAQTVIRAKGANLDGTVLREASFLTFDTEGRPRERVEADLAELQAGHWLLRGVKRWPLGADNPETAAERLPQMTLTSSLTAGQIRDSFGDPAAISVWKLPGFIERLQAAGFTARRHQVFLQTELAQPAFLTAMLLIGAGFTMRHQRGGRVGVMVLGAILLSFGVYFLRNFAQILGENGQIPPAMAAWAPPVAAILSSLGLLLHLEDG